MKLSKIALMCVSVLMISSILMLSTVFSYGKDDFLKPDRVEEHRLSLSSEKYVGDYQAYTWSIELCLANYNIERIGYTVKNTTIQNTSGSHSPLIGEFLNDMLVAYHGNLYTRFGDLYLQYYDFSDFVYMSVFREIINAEKHLTAEYLSENDDVYKELKETRGDDFRPYDPTLTVYQKNEYILINGSLFLLDHENRKLIEQNKNENFDFEQLTVEKERILSAR